MLNVYKNIEINKIEFSKLMKPFEKLLGDNIAIAVSGGSDSMVLLYLLKDWVKETNKTLLVYTFDHNLRKESKEEAFFVKKYCKKNCIRHKTINWIDSKPHSGIQEKARIARYYRLSSQCKEDSIKLLFVAHHADDLAETVAMRLLSKSRLDGLAPIPLMRKYNDIIIARPFLSIHKSSIISFANKHDIKFRSDPSNYNTAFTRIKMRVLLAQNQLLKRELLSSEKVFRSLRTKLNYQMILAFKDHVKYQKEGYFIIKKSPFIKYPEFLNFKFLNLCLLKIGSKNYPPRTKNLKKILQLIKQENNIRFTVSGCIIAIRKKDFLIIREFSNINESIVLKPNSSAVWDKKHRVINKSNKTEYIINALGTKGWNQIKNNVKKDLSNLPFSVKITLPSFNTLDGLVSVPHLKVWKSLKEKRDISVCLED